MKKLLHKYGLKRVTRTLKKTCLCAQGDPELKTLVDKYVSLNYQVNTIKQVCSKFN